MSPACVALCTQLQPLYLSAPLREGKGKSMGLLWSGTKAVIKRCTRQSHTRHQELKSFACATLIFTPLVTHLTVCVCVCLTITPSLCYSHTPSFPSQIDSSMHILTVIPTHMHADTDHPSLTMEACNYTV